MRRPPTGTVMLFEVQRLLRARALLRDFCGECGIFCSEHLCSPPEVPMFSLDAEPSREERGHRGVRPRHPRVD
jgi:hypothetical protein